MEQMGSIYAENEENEKIENLVTSTKSLSRIENDSFKCLWPQIVASLAAASFHFGHGISTGYSAVLICQLDEPGSDFNSTQTEKAFMASIFILVSAIASLITGVLMDKLGRLTMLKISIVPGILGWTSVALAPNMNIIIIGRILIGITSALGTNPAIVYITEISNPKMRTSFMQLCPTFVSCGMMFAYVAGWYFHWRTVAWISNVLLSVPFIFVFFIHESPPWLIFRGKLKEAKKSLNWLHKYQPPDKEGTFAELQFKIFKKQQEDEEPKTKRTAKDILQEFLKPTGYKPLIIMCPLFFCQHFSGIFITMFYSITFIQEVGSTVNPYFASAMIGMVRFIMAIINIFAMKYVTTRTSIMTSCIGMAIFMSISGLYTFWIKEGESTATWVPVMALLMYVMCSVMGLMFLPFSIISELFPLQIRGVGYTIGYALATLFMFGALQSYFFLNEALGGATHLQWFFAAVAMAGSIYTYVFLPETKDKKLNEISENFKEGWMYIGRSHKKNYSKSTDIKV